MRWQAPARRPCRYQLHGFGIVLRDALAVGVHDPEIELCGGITLFRSLPDRVEIVLCQEHHDGEATRHDHGSSYADQPWHLICWLQMRPILLSPSPIIYESTHRVRGLRTGAIFLYPPGNSPLWSGERPCATARPSVSLSL